MTVEIISWLISRKYGFFNKEQNLLHWLTCCGYSVQASHQSTFTEPHNNWKISLFFFACWVIFLAFVVVWRLFRIIFFQKILSRTLSECQMIWIKIRTDILLVLIWAQTVCKDYQQTPKVSTSKESKKENVLSMAMIIEKYRFIDKLVSSLIYHFPVNLVNVLKFWSFFFLSVL